MKKAVGITVGLFVMVIVFWWVVNLDSLLIVVRFLFVTDKNKMNWIGLTGIIAIVGLVYNLYDGRRRFRGDVRSKSRLEWMNTVRPLLANYVTHISKYLFLYDTFAFANNDQQRSQKNKELTEKMEQIRSEYYQLILYVPDNTSNVLLIRNINLLFGELNNIVRYYERGISSGEIIEIDTTSKQEIVDDYISELISKTIQEGGTYFKNEWERAKKGK